MALSVNTNYASLTAQNNLQASQSRLTTSLQRLSTGLKINSAGDDPAGLVTSSLQASQISGLQTSIQNIQTGTALAQTADSSLANINNLLVQVRTLAANSANTATQSTASLAANQASATALLSSIDNISTTTKFGTVALLDGTFSAQQFQTGAFSGQTSSLTIAAADSTTLGVNGIDLTTAAGATAALTAIDAAISTVATARGNIGSFITGTLTATQNNNQSQLTNLQQAQSILTDTNYQTEIATYTSENIRQQAASTVLGFANQSNQSIISLLRGQ
ncbi:flagellin N-terminal helical domain-containing protein [Schlesneria paludicola]|uniref:flagellin N-terminal helical domain-containing protein n=1 Tax=Schlesneria paludicola TaxID=360056 RepID=UPI00029A5AC6|nr:flagellin [Schlesneria paludicola]